MSVQSAPVNVIVYSPAGGTSSNSSANVATPFTVCAEAVDDTIATVDGPFRTADIVNPLEPPIPMSFGIEKPFKSMSPTVNESRENVESALNARYVGAVDKTLTPAGGP